jgi:predicted lipoprotein with Yx(FWY)xxD motif
MLPKLSVAGLLAALVGCVGYSDASGSLRADASADAGVQGNEPGPDVPEAGQPKKDAGVAQDGGSVVPDEDAGPPDPEEADVLLGFVEGFDGYLMDAFGQPLYMFVEDVARADTTACLSTCAKEWPPFDVEPVRAGQGLLINEFERFHRQDGRWQVTYKGHPLYYKADETGQREITGDGLGARWFVARDYLAFLSKSSTFAPAGSTSFDALFLTNGFGRTLYLCLDDTPASFPAVPVSTCLGECARRRPLWSVSEAGRTSILPSIMPPGDLGQFTRPDGALQLTYRGWPLYYFGGDQGIGDVHGHNEEAWRALDPLNVSEEPVEL